MDRRSATGVRKIERPLLRPIRPALCPMPIGAARERGTYRSLFDTCSMAALYCQMLFDEQGPDDFVYLSENEPFGRLTGLKNVVGKRATESFRESGAEPGTVRDYGCCLRLNRKDLMTLASGAVPAISTTSLSRVLVAVFVISERKQASCAAAGQEEWE